MMTIGTHCDDDQNIPVTNKNSCFRLLTRGVVVVDVVVDAAAAAVLVVVVIVGMEMMTVATLGQHSRSEHFRRIPRSLPTRPRDSESLRGPTGESVDRERVLTDISRQRVCI